MSKALSPTGLRTLFTDARSYDRFIDRPVPDDLLHQIWDLTKMGPTSANQLPARLIWCVSDAAKERVAQHAFGDNKRKIVEAPVCVILATDLDFHELLPELFPLADAKSWFADPVARKTAADRNSTLQGGYFIMAVRACGLDAGPMSAFDNEAIDREFFADQPSVRSNFLCVIGYGDPACLPTRSPRPSFERFNQII